MQICFINQLTKSLKPMIAQGIDFSAYFDVQQYFVNVHNSDMYILEPTCGSGHFGNCWAGIYLPCDTTATTGLFFLWHSYQDPIGDNHQRINTNQLYKSTLALTTSLTRFCNWTILERRFLHNTSKQTKKDVAQRNYMKMMLNLLTPNAGKRCPGIWESSRSRVTRCSRLKPASEHSQHWV